MRCSRATSGQGEEKEKVNISKQKSKQSKEKTYQTRASRVDGGGVMVMRCSRDGGPAMVMESWVMRMMSVSE